MEIRDVAELMNRAGSATAGARKAQLHPAQRGDHSLLAVDLLEVQPGATTSLDAGAEEQVVFVLSGSGEASTQSGGATVHLEADSLLRVSQGEAHRFRNTGSVPLRLLVVTSLIAWSPRALGLPAPETRQSRPNRVAETPATVATTPPPQAAAPLESVPAAPPQAATPTPTHARPAPAVEAVEEAPAPPEGVGDAAAPLPDISGLLKRASDLPRGTRPERKRLPEPEPTPVEAPADLPAHDEEEEAPSNLMDLLAVFDGGSRGNPGQGYGSFLVQSPGRKPVIKRLEFGDNYTNNQAEYDTLIGCLNYIIERLEITNRSPQQVQLEIKTDSDLVANQLLGTFKVKDAGLRKRHTQALELLDRFANWSIEWHPREESVRLLGH